MSKIITNDNGQRYQTPGFWKTTGAVLAGDVVSGAVVGSSMLVTQKCMSKMKALSQSCDTVTLRNAVNQAFSAEKLAAKGVKFMDVNEKTVIVNEIYNNLPDYIKKLILPLEAVKKGNNAFYMPKNKTIMVNIDKLGLSSFHEMGHAVNHNCSKFWKYAQKSRPVMMAAAGSMALIALIKRPKADGENPKNGLDKATTFIKNNVGKLVTLCFVPIVAEELKATQRGNKIAKEVLSKEMFAKVKKFNRFGATTYIATGIVAGLGAFLATKVRDKIAHPEKV